MGTRVTPIANECRNITEGIQKGDFKKVTQNMALAAGLSSAWGATSGGSQGMKTLCSGLS